MPNNGPTFAGFLTFVRDVMGIDPLYLPDANPIIDYAYQASFMVVNQSLAVAGCPPGSTWSIYAMAVYNLGGSNIVNYTQDQPGRVFFQELRNRLGIDKFQPGIVAGTSDQGTAVSLLTPEVMKNFSMANLQQVKDPWGRAYLAFAQDYGTLWGIS